MSVDTSKIPWEEISLLYPSSIVWNVTRQRSYDWRKDFRNIGLGREKKNASKKKVIYNKEVSEWVGENRALQDAHNSM